MEEEFDWGLYDPLVDQTEAKKSQDFSSKKSNDRSLSSSYKKPQNSNDDFEWDIYEETPQSIQEKPVERKSDFKSSLKDAAKQFAKETLIGATGTYGDLIELAGPRKEQQLQERDEVDELTHGITPIPSSRDIREVNEAIGGPGEPETEAGRYASRVGRLYGTGAAFGQLNPIPAALAGAAGQYTEEKGGGPLLQAASEIATLLLTGGVGNFVKNRLSGVKPLVKSVKKEVEEKINALRNIGYTEEDITLAINSASKGKKFGVKASKGSKTEQAFEDFYERSDDIVKGVLESEIPGIEKGTKNVHDLASEAYGQVIKDAEKINIKNIDSLFDTIDSTIKEVKSTLGHNSEAKELINELTHHGSEIISKPTADNIISFYRKLNRIGKWVGRNQKDRLIKNVKESIKDSFQSEGREGIELAERFEKVNSGIQKAYKAEDVFNLVEKSRTQEGIDYKKLYKVFDKIDNVKLFEDVIGSKQTKNLQQIAKTGKEIKDFDKSWKHTSLLTGTPTSIISNAAYYIYSHNWVGLAGIKGMEAASRKLSELALTDPKFQNIIMRGLHAVKNESPRLLRVANSKLENYLKDKELNQQKD